MKEIIIRHVRAEDLDECFAVETSGFPLEEAATRTTIRLRIDIFPQGFLVAESDGRVIGMLNSGATDKHDISDEELKQMIGHNPGGRNMVIFALAVLPEFRRQGIARQLMRRFVEASRALNKQNVLLLCKQALIGYYQQLGFDRMGISSSRHGGAEWHEMRLKL